MKTLQKAVIHILASLFTAGILAFSLIYVAKSKELTPKQLYNNNILSVVELRASSESIGESFGTAVFISSDGTLVTNAHVVTYTQLGNVLPFDNYAIRLSTETQYRSVELIKYDSSLDIAILKVRDNSFKFKAINIGDSNLLESGDTIYAIGNTINYGVSISKGIVGKPLIEIVYYGITRKVIQCDLTIAEGNSGGALINSNGELVGITTFRTKDNLGNVVYGIAYCIPINIVLGFVNENNH